MSWLKKFIKWITPLSTIEPKKKKADLVRNKKPLTRRG
jgi:hypothetical protein